MTQQEANRIGRRLLAGTIVLLIVAIIARIDAADARQADEWPVDCDTSSLVVQWPKTLKQRGPQGQPEWGVKEFLVITQAFANRQAIGLRKKGWEVDERSMWCDNFYVSGPHTARLTWHILAVSGPTYRPVVMEAISHCRMWMRNVPVLRDQLAMRCAGKRAGWTYVRFDG